MPGLPKHLASTERNQNFADFLDSNQSYYEWAIVGLFYSALHLVEAYAAHVHGEDHYYHGTRRDFIKDEPDLAHLWNKYEHLKQSSEGARYRGRRFSATDYEDHVEILKSVRDDIEPHLP